MIKFRLREKNSEKGYFIDLPFDSEVSFFDWMDINCEVFEEFLDSMEVKHGVHDFEVEDGCCGYVSNEIKDYDRCIDDWKVFFEKYNLTQ